LISKNGYIFGYNFDDNKIFSNYWEELIYGENIGCVCEWYDKNAHNENNKKWIYWMIYKNIDDKWNI